MQSGRSFCPKFSKADDFGHKLLVDHNEKLVINGVTNVVPRERYFGMITGYAKMEIKDNLAIYEKTFS